VGILCLTQLWKQGTSAGFDRGYLNTLTLLELSLLSSSKCDETRQTLGLPLLLVDLAPELCSLVAELLSVLFESGKLVPPEVRLSHEEVQAAGQPADLRLEFIASIDERGGTLANGVLDVLLGRSEARRGLGVVEGGDSFEE